MTAFSTAQLSQRWLIVAPHPDDEVLGCGLLMRAITAAGGKLVMAWLTDGGASHGELAGADRVALVNRRQSEALSGLAALGVEPQATCFLGHPDGSLSAPAVQAAVRQQLAFLSNAHAVEAFVVTAADDGHPDHRSAFAATSGLTSQGYAYPVSGRYDGEAVSVPETAIQLCEPAGSDHKRAALGCHISQTPVGGARWPLSDATIDRFCNAAEVFIPISRSAG